MKCFYIAILILIVLMTVPASAEMQPLGQAGMTFLNIGGSARAEGMAGVYGHAKNDLSTIFYNPAGLASVDGGAFYVNYTDWLADMSVSHFAVSYHLGDFGTVGVQGQLMDYGEINGTVVSTTNETGYEDIGALDDVAGLCVGLSYGIQLTEKFAVGATVKYINQQLGRTDSYSAGSLVAEKELNAADKLAFDLGTAYDTGFRTLQVTMFLRNFSNRALYEYEKFWLPQTYHLGVAADMFTLTGFEFENQVLTLALEMVDQQDRKPYLAAGIEYSHQDFLFVRGGWNDAKNDDTGNGVALGVGANMELSGFGGRVDLSWNNYGTALGNVLRFSVQGRF